MARGRRCGLNGDEMRIYYKQEGKASRVMNVSKTDIYKK
jgi:hypothetical protein